VERLSRRQFLARAAALGAGVAATGPLLAACGGDPAPAASGGQPTGGATAAAGGSSGGNLVIAYQPGIGYAQLLIAKQNKKIEQAMPNTKVEFRSLSSGSAIRDGMIAGEIHVGSGGVGPFLVGWDRGVGWRLLTALNEMDLWLMVKDQKFKSLKDFGPTDKIACPAPDSIQAVVLRRGAQEQLGDAKKLDPNITALAHPDGLQALISGQIAGHLTAPPFQFQEQEQGARKILSSFDLFGPSTFNSVYVTQTYHDENPQAMKAILDAVRSGTDLINNQPDEAARILSEESGGKTSAEKFKSYITAPGVGYTMEPKGFAEYAKFMNQIGLLEKTPGSWQDLVFENIGRGS
jgi:NitT/TauT family transport system substrate-binding protein